MTSFPMTLSDLEWLTKSLTRSLSATAELFVCKPQYGLKENVCKRIIVEKWEMHCGETHMPSLVFNCYNLGEFLLLPCVIRWGVMLQNNQLKGNYFPHAMLCIKAKSVERYLSLCLSVYPSIVRRYCVETVKISLNFFLHREATTL